MKYIFTLLLCGSVAGLFSQSITGTWQGDLNIQSGMKLPLILHIQPTDSGWNGTLDSPAQGAKGIPVTTMQFKDGELSFTIQGLGVSYIGRFEGDSIVGTFSQGGIKLPLILTRSAVPNSPVAPKPATKTQNSSFTELPISLDIPTGRIYGTLTLPKSTKPVPLVLFIAGSGPTDRNGNNSLGVQTDCTLQLAQALAEQKIASVRYDKRGIGESAGAIKSEVAGRFEDNVQDAKAWLTKLKKDDRFSSLIVAGHSEGSLIGMLAVGGLGDGFISIAGAGAPADQILQAQLKKQLPGEVFLVFQKSLDSLKNGFSVHPPNPELASFMRPSVQPYLISWFKYDPAIAIKKLTIPILIIQGTKDVQITEKDAQNLHAAQPKSSLILIKNMNHVLKNIVGGLDENQQSYLDPSVPIDPRLVQSISHFILPK